METQTANIPNNNNVKEVPAFQLKGSLFTLTVLQLLTADLSLIESQLTAQIQRSSAFFKNAPIIIELQRIANLDEALDFNLLGQLLRDVDLIPVGVRGGSSNQNHAAILAGLAVFNPAKTLADTEKKSSIALLGRNKLISQPVRSGQQVYARGGDLIITASVSPGAELLADGNIHVYGALRGRALAGVSGDKTARIFCKTLAAELVSIAGHYWVAEDLKVPMDHIGIQIYLDEDHLQLGIL